MMNEQKERAADRKEKAEDRKDFMFALTAIANVCVVGFGKE